MTVIDFFFSILGFPSIPSLTPLQPRNATSQDEAQVCHSRRRGDLGDARARSQETRCVDPTGTSSGVPANRRGRAVDQVAGDNQRQSR